jgi:hypothetical protein
VARASSRTFVVCAVLAGTTAFAAAFACGGTTGSPAAPSAVASPYGDAAAVDAGTPPLAIALLGRIVQSGTDAGIPGAFVIAQLGGLGTVGQADGAALATTAVDTNIRAGAITDDAGAFALSVTAGSLGLRAVALGSWERSVQVQALAATDGPVPPTVVALDSLAPPSTKDAGAVVRPVATSLTPETLYPTPGSKVSFAVRVAAGTSADPLSGQVFLVEPTTRWAGVLVPPVATVPGGPYPDGVYNALVPVPSTPGPYTYTLVAISTAGILGQPVSVTVTVSPTGAAPLGSEGDGGLDADAGFFFDGGGLPDGRR